MIPGRSTVQLLLLLVQTFLSYSYFLSASNIGPILLEGMLLIICLSSNFLPHYLVSHRCCCWFGGRDASPCFHHRQLPASSECGCRHHFLRAPEHQKSARNCSHTVAKISKEPKCRHHFLRVSISVNICSHCHCIINIQRTR